MHAVVSKCSIGLRLDLPTFGAGRRLERSSSGYATSAMKRDPARGHRIAALRRARGRTQRAVADTLGVSERAYQEWEAGGKVTWDNLTAFAALFDSSPEFILDGTDGPPADPVEALARRVGQLEASFAALKSLPDALGQVLKRFDALESTLGESVAGLDSQLRDLAHALADLQTGQGYPPPPQGEVRPPQRGESAPRSSGSGATGS